MNGFQAYTKSTVHTILDEADIKLHKITYYCEQRAPDFDIKMHNVLLVYKQLQFEFVFTLTHVSWLNMVEGFFSKMTKQMLRGIRVKSKEELRDRIYKYFDEVNEEPVVFHWKYNLHDIEIMESVTVDMLPVKKTS